MALAMLPTNNMCNKAPFGELLHVGARPSYEVQKSPLID